MSATLHLQIVTPEEKIFDGQVANVTLPGVEGEFCVLPAHVAMLTAIQPGELQYEQANQKFSLAVGEGFVEVTGNSVSVLTDLAVKEPDIDEIIVREAMQRAEDALRSKTLVGEELEATQAAIARSLAQLNLKRRHHG